MSAIDPTFTATEARKWLSYDAVTGVITLLKCSKSTHVGTPVGSLTAKGYLATRCRPLMGSRSVMNHRLAWLLHYGVWPQGDIDHIDGNKINNAIDNLRILDCEFNTRRRPDVDLPNGGILHEPKRRGKQWRACTCVHGHTVWLGLYKTKAEALAAREGAIRLKNALLGTAK